MNLGAFWAVGLFFALAAVMGSGWFHFTRQGAQMKTYITTEGTVLSARMTSYKSTGRKGKNYTYYEPIMEYTYMVDGEEYTSASIVFGKRGYSSTSRGEIEKIVDHPVGGAITVFYNPDKPDESFLDKKASSDLETIAIFAVFTVLFGAAGIGITVMGIMGIMGIKREIS